MLGDGRWICVTALVLLCLVLPSCDSPPPRQDKKLPMPKGESTLDDLIKRAQTKPAPPPVPPRLGAEPGAIEFPATAVGETSVRQIRIANSGDGPASL